MKQTKNMKKTLSRAGALAMCLVLLLSMLTLTAFAAEDVTATLSPQTKIVVDGVTQTFYNTSGTEVHPIRYNSTVYLPARAIAELMGKTMSWDEATLTATISAKRSTKVTGTPDTTTTQKEITAQLRSDFTFVVDGATRSFTDASGASLSPMLYGGTIYLPLRSVGELMGKAATWDSGTNTATLSARTGGSLVTDTDATGSRPAVNQPATSGGQTTIGEEKAKSIALSHAGLSASDVTFARAYLDRDDGRWEYDVEFYTSDYSEYDYEIDAYTGTVLSYDYDAEYYNRPSNNSGSNSSSNSGSYIGEAKAKEIAFSRAGVSSGSVYAYQCELDREYGTAVYEIDFKADGYEYEVDVNATTGAVTKYSREWDD